MVRGAISPNERLQERYHSWTSYVIVPLFALANADIKISGSFLAHAYTSPATLGIMIGYIVGKPIGTAGARLAGQQGDQGAADAAGRLGRGPRRRRGRRDRVHRRAADRLARASPAPSWPRPSSASCPARSAPRCSPGLVFRGARTGSRRGPGCGRCSAPRRRSPTWRCPSTRSATTSAARGRTRSSRWSSTATSSARTAGRPSRAVRELIRRARRAAVRLPAPAAHRGAPARAARRRGRRGGGPSRARSGRCTTC